MHEAAELIRALAALLWPLVVVGVVIFVLPSLRVFIRNSDSIDVEVAGTKVSVQRASEEVRKLISDLQDRVNQIETERAPDSAPGSLPARVETSRRTILWVDDRLDANVYERARLEDAGYRVIQAESTVAASNLLKSEGSFELIISDMGRVEGGGRLNPTAGLDFLRQLRESGDQTPVVFYSSGRSLARVRGELESFDRVSYTTSPSELMRLVGVR